MDNQLLPPLTNSADDLLGDLGLNLCLNFFADKNPDKIKLDLLNNELGYLFEWLRQLVVDSRYPGYPQLLYALALELDQLTDEAVILDRVVTEWSLQRGQLFSADKNIDEFYTEFELFMLCYQLINSVNDQEFSKLRLISLRRIIKRYGKLSELWQYLCQISGEEIKTSYTF